MMRDETTTMYNDSLIGRFELHFNCGLVEGNEKERGLQCCSEPIRYC